MEYNEEFGGQRLHTHLAAGGVLSISTKCEELYNPASWFNNYARRYRKEREEMWRKGQNREECRLFNRSQSY
jgi:hypothetical protein